MIRLFDIVFSLFGLLILLPVLIIIYLIVIFESAGGGFYVQNRVGKGGKDFKLFKFRSMQFGSDKKGLLTIGDRDPRMTKSGKIIRRFKLDELPQLYNVLNGTMSFVGPRPEVRKYVELYTLEQLKVLEVRPGITDYASIEYVDENAKLGLAIDPEKVYIEEILPDKIKLNMKYIDNPSANVYFKIIILTFWNIVRKR